MRVQTSAPAFVPVNSSTLVVLDPTIDHYLHLLEGLRAGAEVILLDPAQDAISQVTQALSDRRHLTSLHLISHGRSGELQFGSTRLNSAALGQYAWHQWHG